jgi:exopolyphosphatase/guanosine-5'-triphosphate,3'-diphosphate pyrophosphatase
MVPPHFLGHVSSTVAMESQQFILSPELGHRLAAIDIGTNSIRMIVAEGLRDGKYRILDDEKDATRLGKNLATTGRLDAEAIERAIQTLRRMHQIVTGYQVQDLRAIATCAVREAADGAEFCRRVQAEVGLSIEIVTADEEARLAFYGVQRSFDLDNKNIAVVDIGGGSTEIVLASNNLIESIDTTPLGAVRLTERYGGALALTNEQFERLLRSIDRMLRKHTAKPHFAPHLLIGSGGTFTTLAAMIMATKGLSNLPVQGYQVSRAEVRHLLDRIRKLPPKARRAVPGLSPDRADIIVAGLAVIDSVMRRFHVNTLAVHTGGVRDGLLLTMVNATLGPAATHTHDRQASALGFAARCGVDLPHCQHVARLAVSIFNQLVERFGLVPSDQSLLEAAAWLQDVGYLINYDQHHKHSYHLILNSRLAGFQPHELELVANIARYHRGARPKKKHANFRSLSRKDRRRVRQLAGILRLAVGFDRSHSQQVRDVQVDAAPHSVQILLVADELPEVDLWGARRRGELFERAFRTHLKLEWLAPPGHHASNGQSESAAESAAAEQPPDESAEPSVEPTLTNGGSRRAKRAKPVERVESAP